MYRGSRPRILPVFITIVVVVIVIAVAVTLVRSMLQGGTPNDNQQSDQAQKQTLQMAAVSQDATRSVRWTVRGPIVADEKFKIYKFFITTTYRTYKVFN